MSLAVGISIYRRTTAPQPAEQFYFAITLCLIASGVIFTTVFHFGRNIPP